MGDRRGDEQAKRPEKGPREVVKSPPAAQAGVAASHATQGSAPKAAIPGDLVAGLSQGPSGVLELPSLKRELVSAILRIPSGGRVEFRGDSPKGDSMHFVVYYDQEDARGDYGQRVPGMVSGEYEVWGRREAERESLSKAILRQHMSPGPPMGMQQGYAAERCADAIMADLRRLRR